jgi:hypothetical protein
VGSFIKLYRSILKWEWYHDKNVCRLFIHLLLMANYEDKRWNGIVIKRGQFLTSLSGLEQQTGLTYEQARLALKKLKSTGEITCAATNSYTLVTIVKYGDYQDKPSGNNKQKHMPEHSRTTGRPHSGHRQTTTTKEYKETEEYEENKEIRFIKPSVDNVRAYCKERGSRVDPEAFVDFYESKGWYIGDRKMADWKAAVRTWEKRDGRAQIIETDESKYSEVV